MNKRDYVRLARAAVSDLDERGVALSDSVKSAAADMNLNSEQTRRLVEFTNTVAHLHLFDKESEDKYIQFDLVDPDEVLPSAVVPDCEEKVAHAEPDMQDFFLDLPDEKRQQVKTAADETDATSAFLAATSAVDPQERPYANGRNLQAAQRLQKIASELEMRTVMEYERYLDGVRKLAFELERRTDEEKRAFVEDVRGIFRDGADNVLITLDVVNPKLQVGEIKEASAFPFSSTLTQSFGDLIVDRERVLDAGRGYKYIAARIGA